MPPQPPRIGHTTKICNIVVSPWPIPRPLASNSFRGLLMKIIMLVLQLACFETTGRQYCSAIFGALQHFTGFDRQTDSPPGLGQVMCKMLFWSRLILHVSDKSYLLFFIIFRKNIRIILGAIYSVPKTEWQRMKDRRQIT